MPDSTPIRSILRASVVLGLALLAPAWVQAQGRGASDRDLPRRDLGVPAAERELPTWSGAEAAPREPFTLPALEIEARRLWSDRAALLESDPAQAGVLLDMLMERALAAGQREMPLYAAALVREAGDIRRRGDLATAEERLTQARRLAPDLPHPRLAQAALLFRRGPARWPEAFGELVEATRIVSSSLDESARTRVNATVTFAVTASLVAILFPIVVILRHRRGLGHLLAHLGPGWLARPLQGLVLGVGVLVAWYLGVGAGWLVCMLFLPAWLAASRREQALLGLVLLAVAAVPLTLPSLVDGLARVERLREDPVLRAQREALSADLVDALVAEIERAPDPREAIAALALVEKRGGQLDFSEAAYRHVIEEGLDGGWIRNNLANVLMNARLRAAEGTPHDALRDAGMVEYDRAIQLDPELAEPWFNKSQVWREEYDLVRSYPAFEEAQRLDPDGVNSFYVTTAPTLNRVLMDVPLPRERFERRLLPDPEERTERVRALASIFMRGLPPIAATLVIVALGVVGLMVSAATRELPVVPPQCTRCGAPLCELCAPTPGDATECEGCLSLAIGNPILDPVFKQERRRAIDRSQRRARWVAIGSSLVLPGAGHLQMGAPVAGFAWIAASSLSIAMIALGGGFVPPRVAVWNAAGGTIVLWVAVLVVTYLSANLGLVRALRKEA